MRESRRTAPAVMALVAGICCLLGAIGPVVGTASAAGPTPVWVDGTSDSDTIVSCILGTPQTGISASAGFLVDKSQLPRVGERFYVRVILGLVGMPCSGKAAVLPEFLPPSGVDFDVDASHPITYALTPSGGTDHFTSSGLAFGVGVNGGLLVGTKSEEYADGGPWLLNQAAGILEIRVPMVAHRVLKGMATRQPECQDRRDGVAPCKLAESGDHLQVAITTADGGDKHYVTPYVGLFAQPAAGQPTGSPTQKARSTTTARFAVAAHRRGKATVQVSSSVRPTGTVAVYDGRRKLATARLRPQSHGRIVVRLRPLGAGGHRLQARYLGSSMVRPSASAVKRVRLR